MQGGVYWYPEVFAAISGPYHFQTFLTFNTLHVLQDNEFHINYLSKKTKLHVSEIIEYIRFKLFSTLFLVRNTVFSTEIHVDLTRETLIMYSVRVAEH